MRAVVSPETGHFYEFGNFRLYPSAKILFCENKPVALTPKVFELQIFVEHTGRLLEKDELMQKIWQDSFVEESNLTFNIKMLRRALKDDAHEPRFIENVLRRGYRFIAEVKESFPDIAAKTESNETAAIYPPATASGSDRAPERSYLPIAADMPLQCCPRRFCRCRPGPKPRAMIPTDKEKVNLEIYAERQNEATERERCDFLTFEKMLQALPCFLDSQPRSNLRFVQRYLIGIAAKPFCRSVR